MVRSPAFGSTMQDSGRAFRTRFRYGYRRLAFSLALHGNSPDHYAKGTPSGIPAEAGIALRPLVGTRFQVLFHSPYRGSFHSSLTLLCAIGRRVVLSLGRWSSQIHGGFHVTADTRDASREKRVL